MEKATNFYKAIVPLKTSFQLLKLHLINKLKQTHVLHNI